MGSIAKKYQKNKGFESLNRNMLQDNTMSLEARGLLAYMESMPEKWVFHKTILHRIFQKNKRSSVDRVWNELLDNNYLIAFRKRDGKKYVYEYYFSQDKFEEEDILLLQKDLLSAGYELAPRTSNKKNNVEEGISNIVEPSEIENHVKVDEEVDFWDADYQQSNLDSSKAAGIKSINKKLTKEYNDTDQINTKRYEKLGGRTHLTDREVLEMGNFPFLSDRTIQLLSIFGEEAPVLIDKIYESKRKVEKENQIFSKEKSMNTDTEKIHGDLWANDIERCVKQFIFKYKTGITKDTPIKNLVGYFYKSMQRLWEMAYIIESNISIMILIEQQDYAEGIIYQHFPNKLTKKQLDEELNNSRDIRKS